MKIIIQREKLNFTPAKHLQMAGYTQPRTREGLAEGFVRRLGSGFYPRFHIYMNETEDTIELKLHLDQKRPSYEGAHAHNAEYDGDLLEREAGRILSVFGITE